MNHINTFFLEVLFFSCMILYTVFIFIWFYLILLVISIYATFRQRFLCKIESFEIFRPLTISIIDKSIKLFLCHILSFTVLVYEFFDSEITTSNSYNYLIIFYFHKYSLFSILIHSFRLSHKVHLSFLLRRSIIYVLSQLFVDWIIFERFVYAQQISRVMAIRFQLMNNLL